MKVVGVREVSGTNKETGRPWSGIKVYYTEPVRSHGAGFVSGSAYFGGDSAAMVRSVAGEDYSALIGADVTFTYNRFGRPVGLTFD